METLYEEIGNNYFFPKKLNYYFAVLVKLRTICLSNKKFLNTIYTKVNSLEFGHQPNNNPQSELKNIPMKTLNEVQEFELELNKKNIKTSLVSFILY